jgi:hypothetical protein
MKECNKCKNILSLDEFHNNKRMKDGKQRSCKACVKIKDAKHWVKSGKKQPKRIAKKKLSKFKNIKLRDLKSKASSISEKRKELESFESLFRCRERGFVYDGMNDNRMSFHICNGTEHKLINSRMNYKRGIGQYKEYDDIARIIEGSKDEYKCECCFSLKNLNQYKTTYDINIYRDRIGSDWLIKDIFVNVLIYCTDCISEGETPRDIAINKLYGEERRMLLMINNYYNSSDEELKQRYKWSQSKSKHESKFLSNIDRSEDGKYLYIMEWRGVYKVGISNKPLIRLSSIKANLPGNSEVDLLFICKPYKGRCVDNETLIHKSLKEYRADVTWKDGKKSREFFKCDLSLIKLAVSEQCYIEDAKELMA